MSADGIVTQVRTDLVKSAVAFDATARKRVREISGESSEDFRDAYLGSLMAGAYGYMLGAVLRMAQQPDRWSGEEIARWVQDCIDNGDFDDMNDDLDLGATVTGGAS